jgi:hypothetical protein
MGVSGLTAVVGRLGQFNPDPMEPSRAVRRSLSILARTPADSSPASLQSGYIANTLAHLLETARRELGRDRELAKASLLAASTILQAEIERSSRSKDSTWAGLASWQILRVQSYTDSNLHRTIRIRDLSAVARRSPSHFSRAFKQAVGESPHAYVEKAAGESMPAYGDHSGAAD